MMRFKEKHVSLLSSKAKRKLGVDISSKAIKIIELSKKNQTYCIERYAIHTFDHVIINGGILTDDVAVLDAMLQLLKKNKFSSKNAVLAVPDSCTLRKVMSVSPHLTAEDLDELAVIEINKLWPHAAETLNFDFQWCKTFPKDPSLRDVLMIASRSDYVEQRAQVAKRVGLRVSAMDIESHALYRLYKLLHLRNRSPIGWLHFDEACFDVYIFDNDMTVFTHREAFNVVPTVDQQGVIIQVQRVLQVFQTSYPMYESLYSFILSETSAGSIWASLLSSYLMLDIIPFNPFETLSFSKYLDRDAFMQQADGFLIACGLALRI